MVGPVFSILGCRQFTALLMRQITSAAAEAVNGGDVSELEEPENSSCKIFSLAEGNVSPNQNGSANT